MRNFGLLSIFLTTLFSAPSFAEPAPDSFEAAITKGTPWLDARYRYEYDDQDGIHKKANASTLRTRIGYATGIYQGFKTAIELEHIATVGNSRYNDGYNGKTNYPQVGDPEDRDINQLYISYSGIPKTNIILGRQLIVLDNERFIGQSNWRQNNQTYDALTLTNESIEHAKFFYGYLSKINRGQGPDSPTGAYDSDSHLFNAAYEWAPIFKTVGYGYFLDFEDARNVSNKNFGIRITGTTPINKDFTFSYAAEAANQRDYGDNPLKVNKNYYLLEPAISAFGFTSKFGYESMGGNGTTAMQFPLATLHQPNGWADKFTTNPNGGLKDKYISLGYKVPDGNKWIKGTDATIVYHEFDSYLTDQNYGTEWNATITQTFFEHYTLGVQFADYNANHLFTDTTKLYTWLGVKF